MNKASRRRQSRAPSTRRRSLLQLSNRFSSKEKRLELAERLSSSFEDVGECQHFPPCSQNQLQDTATPRGLRDEGGQQGEEDHPPEEEPPETNYWEEARAAYRGRFERATRALGQTVEAAAEAVVALAPEALDVDEEVLALAAAEMEAAASRLEEAAGCLRSMATAAHCGDGDAAEEGKEESEEGTCETLESAVAADPQQQGAGGSGSTARHFASGNRSASQQLFTGSTPGEENVASSGGGGVFEHGLDESTSGSDGFDHDDDGEGESFYARRERASYEEESAARTEGKACERYCGCLPMISSHHPARIAWDVVLTSLILWLVIVEPMDAGFWRKRMTRSETAIGVQRVAIDVYFLVDVLLNFRTGIILDDGTESFEPRACAVKYLKTWFALDVASSAPPMVEWIVGAIAVSKGPRGASSLSSAKLLKLGRVARAFKLLRLGKLAKFNSNSPLADRVEDFLASSSSIFLLRILAVCALMILLAHLLACFLAVSGDGWLRYYDPRGDGREDPESWSWRRQYLVAFYFVFSTMTTVGYGDVTPATDVERRYCVVAMFFGVGFYSYLIATVSSMVSSTDAKSAIYFDKMDQLSSWMRHYHFEPVLRRRTRAFFKRFYAQRSAIDERTILENLTPQLQQDVSAYLLHDFVMDHPLFNSLPEGVLWKVLMITRTVSFDAGARVAARGHPSFGLYIMLAGRAKAEYSLRDGPVVSKRTRKSSLQLQKQHSQTASSSSSGGGEETKKQATTTTLVGDDDCGPRLRDDLLEVVNLFPGNSFGELCLLGANTRSILTVTAVTPSEFFLVQRDSFLDAFSNLPEVLDSMIDSANIFARKPIWEIERDSKRLDLFVPHALQAERRRSSSKSIREYQQTIGPLSEDDCGHGPKNAAGGSPAQHRRHSSRTSQGLGSSPHADPPFHSFPGQKKHHPRRHSSHSSQGAGASSVAQPTGNNHPPASDVRSGGLLRGTSTSSVLAQADPKSPHFQRNRIT